MSPKRNTKKEDTKAKHGDAPPFDNGHGRWVKKIRSRLVYFGNVKDDPEGENARRVWEEQKHAIRAGRKPILSDDDSPDGATVRVLCNLFLEAKERAVETGELTQRSWNDYFNTCQEVVSTLGKNRLAADLTPEEFGALREQLAVGKKGKRSLITLKGHMVRTRVLFSWGLETEILERPVRYGASFKLPKAERLRAARNERPKKFFTQPELRKIIDSCGVQLKAMVLLGVNCGLGNADCGRLKFTHLDLKGGWLDFPRRKTGEPRRGKLWPETVKAIKAAIAARPNPANKADRDQVFLTHCGDRWYSDNNRDSPLSAEFSKVLARLGMKRPGVSFYSLRHVLQTVGDEVRDAPALRRMMGHVTASSDVSSHYREHIADCRLIAVSDHVHSWLFPARAQGPRKKTQRSSAR